MYVLLISDYNIIGKNIIKLISTYDWVFISKKNFSNNLLCESILIDKKIVKIIYFYSNICNKKDQLNETYLIHYCNKYNIDTLYLYYYSNKFSISSIVNFILIGFNCSPSYFNSSSFNNLAIISLLFC